MTEINLNITVIIRSIGERTEEKCIEHMENIFGKENVFLVKNAIPFSKAVEQTFQIGLKENKKWTLAIDADVFLFPDKIKEFIGFANEFVEKQKKVYCLEGQLFDKFSQVYRIVGCHLYYTKNLKKALKFVKDGTNDVRPETYVKQKMTKKGYGFYSSNFKIGIHDFFQAPQSIVKKAILHCKKHDDINVWIECWQEQSKTDEDFLWALKGKEIFDSLTDKTIKVDAEFMDSLVNTHDTNFPDQENLSDSEIFAVLAKYNTLSNHDRFLLVFPIKNKSLLSKIFNKQTTKNRKIITILGVKISYKKRQNKFINKFLVNVKSYQAASHKIWTTKPEERASILKLDWNEATIPPSPLVRQRIQELVVCDNFYNLYPSTTNNELLGLLSKYAELPVENIQYFASSDSVHEYISKIYIGINDKVLIQAPSYDNFRLTAEANGGKVIFSEIDSDFTFNPSKFEDDIRKHKAAFVYISNPNNPIGYVHSIDYIEHLLKTFKKTMFLIDEAYYEFSEISCKDLVLKYENILVTRTMSKAFALANFRFGYLLASEKNIINTTSIRNPKNITTFTQEAAIAVLSDIGYMQSYVDEVKKAKKYFIEQIQQFDLQVTAYESSANFVVLKFKSEEMKNKLFNFLKEHQIFVRVLSQSPILNTSLRITIGTCEQMEKVLDVFKLFFQSVGCNNGKNYIISEDTRIALFDFCWTIVHLSTADAFVHFVRKNYKGKKSLKMKLKNTMRETLNKIKITKYLEKISKMPVHKLMVLWQLKDFSKAEIDNYAKLFYETEIKKLFIPEVIEEINNLKKEDYKLFIVSAGYDVYLKYFVEEFNFDGLLCTKIKFNNDICTAVFDGLDCYEENKVTMLEEFFKTKSLKNINSVAYSDSIIDVPLLQYCKRGVVISRNKKVGWVKDHSLEEIICTH